MPFDYGQAAPPEPTPAQVMDVLFAASSQPLVQAPVAVTPPSIPLDSGRYDAVVAVATTSLPGLMDSDIFGPETSSAPVGMAMLDIDRHHHDDVVDTGSSIDVEATRHASVAVVATSLLELETKQVVGDVAAGGTAAATMLDVTIGQRPLRVTPVGAMVRVCGNCGTSGVPPRCVSCGTKLSSGGEER
jgi:hypothetical protein